MYSKMDWKPTDWIDSEDYNRIRQNFAAILNFNSAPPADAGYDYVPTAADVRALRAQYDAIAATLGVLAEFPSDPALYPAAILAMGIPTMQKMGRSCCCA